MSSTCTIHETKMYESKFKPGTFYHYIDGEKANGVCYGEGLGKAVRNGHAEDGQFNHEVTKPDPKVEEKVGWDAKDRQSMAQTAMKSASEIVAAMINAKFDIQFGDAETKTKNMANEFFKEILKMKTLTT